MVELPRYSLIKINDYFSEMRNVFFKTHNDYGLKGLYVL